MMKKLLVFFCALFLSLAAYSQSRVIEIAWESNSSTNNKETFKKNTKNSYSPFKLQLREDKIQFSDQWEDNGFAEPSSLQVSNIRYGDVSRQELAKINTDLIPNQFSARIHSSKAREIIYTAIDATPIVKQNGITKKVLSFTINYTKGRLNNATRMPITNSVLATGEWFKFRIDKTGVYRLSKSFLDDLGMNTNNIDPRNLKIYGHGGKPLPLLSSQNQYFDLPQNAIQVVGEEDGSFDANDAILFYGIGVEGWDEENDTNLNPYSDEAYYYVTASGGNGAGLRVQPMIEPSGTPNQTITTYDNYQFFEQDEESPAKVGRRWVGNRFDIENEQTFEFNFPNIASGEDMRVRTRVVSTAEAATSFAFSINGTSLDPLTLSPAGGANLLRVIRPIFDEEIPASSEDVTVNLTYNNGGNPSNNAYLDYITIWAKCRLQGLDAQIPFFNFDTANSSGIAEYQISNASGITAVWDVTDFTSIRSKENPEGASDFSFKANLGEIRNYVAIDPDDFFSPISIPQPRVQNQDLKGTIFNNPSGAFEDIDYVIVTAPFMIQPALKLANHHKNLNGYNVKVVTTDRIYEEFSSGKQDISAIRNFMRYIYENASTPSERVKYLLLFGDTSVDYKNRLPNNNNIVPTFHTLWSGNTTNCFMSDDFFGSLDPNEGTIGLEDDDVTGNGTDDDLLDVAVGRIVADNIVTANAMVEKVINYSAKESYGNWRNNFVLISDDVDEFFEYEALEVALDNIGDEIEAEKPFVNVKKIHSDAFQQQTSAGGDRYPDVTDAYKNVIDVGALIITYFGHGGEDGLAKEFIFTRDDGINLQNTKLPLIVTVTCEYTKFDDPQRVTAGEFIYTNLRSGAIGLITTTRSITVTLGGQFNIELAGDLFGYGTTDYNTPAEALRISKNTLSGDDLRRVVFFIGDPAMDLAFPQPQVRLTELNGVPIAQSTDVLQALSKVTIAGEVVDENGNLQADYNGVLEAKIFDKKVNRQTLGNDGVRDNGTDPDGDGDPNNILLLNFTTLGEGVFNGQATVTNGQFEFEFVVPRDIQIPLGQARASLYAQRNNELEDQTGVSFDLQIGGLNENAPEDNQGPLISLFMNDESFVSGGITNDSPILIAKMEDENGLNTASGIGHDMVAILDGDETNPFVLNEYYQGDVDDFTKGMLDFRFRDLEPGLHTLTFKAWDVYNNSSTAELQFIVAGDDELKITRVLNYPNPFIDYTEFWFNHNRPFEPLEVQVQIFTVTGKVVWTKNQIVTTDGFLSRDITWDGRDDFGDKIGKGTYVYKITVKSTLTNKRVEKFEKLVIL
ncbi:type IX secretion system sortase PorU [Patiriisocius hiemis]|uniref:Type IX secretion system sortase PorU n=1 Tax=Patiriisocius hiemis TaxID=3075604 RepID=A0ABU2YFG4_9FLAO|nr:type IX secretion system sortase PorU [Constantimarinum sp. W242]MDT0556928.1 type IX secretion system sortase PorU [Constantimarinum sp. W242]